jgi:pimeloyl-ACP methyl ester carboxylesterase
VVGTSLGGIVVSLLALERPELAASLGLVGIDVPMSPTGTLNPDVIKAAMANGTKAMQDVTWESCVKRMANICFDPAASPREVALMQVTIYAQSDRLAAYLALGNDMASREGLDQVRIVPEQIAAPTLVLTGREDIRAGIKVIEANYRRIPDAELVVFERCGHLPHLEHPQKFAEVLLDFLKRRYR